jgi:hypothetical protein
MFTACPNIVYFVSLTGPYTLVSVPVCIYISRASRVRKQSPNLKTSTCTRNACWICRTSTRPGGNRGGSGGGVSLAKWHGSDDSVTECAQAIVGRARTLLEVLKRGCGGGHGICEDKR